MDGPKYLLVVNHVVSSVFNAVDKLNKTDEFRNLKPLVITNNPELFKKYSSFIDKDGVIACSFSSEKEINEALAPFAKDIIGVICRGDKHIQYLRKIIPFLPPSVLVSTPESLEISTNKVLMRSAFIKNYPEISPRFLNVSDSSEPTIQKIKEQLEFPVIIKPANLFSSLLIQTCDTHEELQSGLNETFSQILSIYEREGINEKPQILVEEFLAGDLYSTDAFILGPGEVYCCPLVGYVPAKKLGINDFFLYKRFIPADLSSEEVQEAFTVTKEALSAVGLKYSAAHVELIKTTKGWKIIELGPRLGRFRNIMYGLGYGIDLSLSDIQVHLGLKPDIPKKLISFCSAYSIYPSQEGILKSINGLEELQKTGLVKSLRVLARPGDRALFAKNGGHALAEFVVSSGDEKLFQKTVHFIEKEVRANID